MTRTIYTKDGFTQVKLREETMERLMSFGRKGESVDALINRLLDLYEQQGRKRTHERSR